MPLIKCHECGNAISSSAKTCPSCGVKPKKPRSAFDKAIFWTLILVFVGPVAAMAIFGEQPVAPPSDPVRDEAYANLRIAERSLKEAMRNPSSYETVNALFSRATGAVCIEYRAENGFGGMNVEHAIIPKVGNIKTDVGPAAIAKQCGINPERLY